MLRDEPALGRARRGASRSKVRDVTELLAGPSRARRAPAGAAAASPTTTPATSPTRRGCARSRASCCERSPGWSCVEPDELGALLRLGRRLQPGQARAGRRAGRAQGGATCWPRAPRRWPPATPAARSRSPPTREPGRAAAGAAPARAAAHVDRRPRQSQWRAVEGAGSGADADRRRRRPSSRVLHRRRARPARHAAPRARRPPTASCSRRTAAAGRLDAGDTLEFRERRRRTSPRRRPDALQDRRVEITGPTEPQDGDQRAELGRARLHGRLRGLELARPGRTWSAGR